MEEWVVFEEAPKYLVSNEGRIKNAASGRIIKTHIKKGYLVANIDYNGLWKSEYVHRIVAKSFVLGERPGLFVNHIDGDKSNNCSWNLEWVTHQENMAHATRTGLIRKLRRWEANEDGDMIEVER